MSQKGKSVGKAGERNITPVLEWNVHILVLRAEGVAAEMLAFMGMDQFLLRVKGGAM